MDHFAKQLRTAFLPLMWAQDASERLLYVGIMINSANELLCWI
jgi:hypothetical protein